MVYAKARQEDLTPDEKRLVRQLAAVLKAARAIKNEQGVI
jgi:hypothetical protein